MTQACIEVLILLENYLLQKGNLATLKLVFEHLSFSLKWNSKLESKTAI